MTVQPVFQTSSITNSSPVRSIERMNKNISLLVVDDDEDDFILLKSYLEDLRNYNFSFQWTPDYKAALDLMRHNKHDVVVIDYLMGSHTGLELLKAAMESGCRMPVIVL